MALINTPTHRYTKARVVFNEDETQATIHDYRTNELLDTLSDLKVIDIGRSWSDGNETLIEYDPKMCQSCGSKRTTVRAK